MLEAGRVFESLGQYKQVGVSERGGSIRASVMGADGGYHWETIETVKMDELLGMFGLSHHVEWLFLDVEGAEYDLLPILLSRLSDRSGSVEQANDTSAMAFCQVISNLSSLL
ncbi:unnamed protein product [Anisakis simplex]|uniref:Methyltransf_21 domain-containing protein n=1 Tax=Anisakis simplex TaxID=6269 RepID=A0A0M3JFQ0_ANISI|nr:unnamed protein product [Anisakis simplex]